VTSLQPRGYIAEWLRFFCVVVEDPQGCLLAAGVFLRLLVGELGTPKLAQIFAYDKWLYPYNASRRRIRSGPKMSEMCNSEDGCTFPPKYLRPYPENYPKTPVFEGPFNAKLIIQRALCTLIELQSWKFTVILGTCEASRYDSNSNRTSRFDSIQKWRANSKILNCRAYHVCRRTINNTHCSTTNFNRFGIATGICIEFNYRDR